MENNKLHGDLTPADFGASTDPSIAVGIIEGDVREIVRRLSAKIEEQRLAASCRPASVNWGDVGTMHNVRGRLAEVLADLGDRSAVTELKISY